MPEKRDLHLEDSHYSAPLGAVKNGRLVFASHARKVSLKAGRMKADLYRARFKRLIPGIRLDDGALTIQYHHFPFPEFLVGWRESLAEINLNASLQWEIEFHSGISHLNADLRELQLLSLDILGGASHIRLVLPEPPSTSYIYIAGGVSQCAIHRPPGVGVRLQIHGGASHLLFDGQHYRALKSETSLESTNFKNAPGRYDISIIGGVSHLTIDDQM